MKITIDITAEDIAHGERENGQRCPIALAAHRVLPSLTNLFVDSERFYPLGSPTTELLVHPPFVEMPPDAARFVQAFDEQCQYGPDDCDNDDCALEHPADPLDPFSFELDIPDEFGAGESR